MGCLNCQISKTARLKIQKYFQSKCYKKRVENQGLADFLVQKDQFNELIDLKTTRNNIIIDCFILKIYIRFFNCQGCYPAYKVKEFYAIKLANMQLHPLVPSISASRTYSE